MRTLYLAVLIASLCAPCRAYAATHDGSRDFDFAMGSWHTHIKRLPNPLTGSTAWTTYDRTVTVRPVWGGAASVEEISADGPGRFGFLSVRMYDAKSHQWRLYGVSDGDESLSDPMYGSFENGRGTFYDQEQFGDKMILVRQVFFDITPASYSFEQAFSGDGGRTWEPNFVAKLTRTASAAPSEGAQSVSDTSHDFDFNYGTWSTHITTPDGTMAGVVAVRKIWDGRAYMEEIKASGKAGGFEGLTLFLYNTRSKQWSQTYAGRDDGSFERSMIGGFEGGRGILVSFPSENNGRMEMVREVWSDIEPDSHHFEIQYSHDGGATWDPAFVAYLRRIGPGR